MVTKHDLLPVALLAIAPYLSAADLTYLDGRDLPLEGRAFAETPTYYERLPSSVTTNVNATARLKARDAAGLQFRFRTDSDVLELNWTMRPNTPQSKFWVGDNMTGVLAAGLDIYRQRSDGSWQYAETARPNLDAGLTNSYRLAWKPGEACAIYLPCYGGITDFRLGIRPGAKIERVEHASAAKPVVFYGTSITQGGCASRPGLAWVSIVGRELDVPVVNLGFSGAGRMELEMADHLAAIDASCYVLDCIPNMRDEMIASRFEPFVRRLRAAKPTTPIVVAERTVNGGDYCDSRNVALRRLYERLVASGVKGLSYIEAKKLLPSDREGTVEGGHPNDLGMVAIARAFSKAVRTALPYSK